MGPAIRIVIRYHKVEIEVPHHLDNRGYADWSDAVRCGTQFHWFGALFCKHGIRCLYFWNSFRGVSFEFVS